MNLETRGITPNEIESIVKLLNGVTPINKEGERLLSIAKNELKNIVGREAKIKAGMIIAKIYDNAKHFLPIISN